MTTYLVCPIDGALPGDDGTIGGAQHTVPTASDAVVTASGIIASATGTTVIVSSGASFSVGQYIWVVSATASAKPAAERMLITGIATNTLTVTRSAKGEAAVATFAVGDYVLTGLDVNGNAPHCPLCGAASNVLFPSVVASVTGVAAGSQHPADVDAVYVTNAENVEGQPGATAYTLQGERESVYPHKFAAANRGTATVTAETINGTLGP